MRQNLSKVNNGIVLRDNRACSSHTCLIDDSPCRYRDNFLVSHQISIQYCFIIRRNKQSFCSTDTIRYNSVYSIKHITYKSKTHSKQASYSSYNNHKYIQLSTSQSHKTITTYRMRQFDTCIIKQQSK